MKTMMENNQRIPVEFIRVLCMISVLYVLGFLAACINIQAQDESAAIAGDRIVAAAPSPVTAATLVKRGYANHRAWSIEVSAGVVYEAEFDLATLKKYQAEKRPFAEILYSVAGLESEPCGKDLHLAHLGGDAERILWRFPQGNPDCRSAASLLKAAKKMARTGNTAVDPYLSIVEK